MTDVRPAGTGFEASSEPATLSLERFELLSPSSLERGVVVAYDRNLATNTRLRKQGIEVITISGSERGHLNLAQRAVQSESGGNRRAKQYPTRSGDLNMDCSSACPARPPKECDASNNASRASPRRIPCADPRTRHSAEPLMSVSVQENAANYAKVSQ